MTNLQASNSDLGKYPYNNGTPIPQQIYYGNNSGAQPKSHENRSHDPSKNIKGGGAVRIQFHKSNYEKSASNSRSKLKALTMANQSNSAYTRADKLLSYQQLEFE